jgi:hypothetical protein
MSDHQYHVERSDGQYLYIHKDTGNFHWIPHKSHSNRVSFIEAVLLCRVQPENEKYVYRPVQS